MGCMILNEHIDLSGVWLSVNLRMNTKKTWVGNKLDYMLEIYSRPKLI